nr:MAG TPA: hypothetical protein [Bacteriophage sp.]
MIFKKWSATIDYDPHYLPPWGCHVAAAGSF